MVILINKNSSDYKEGFKKGVQVTCDHLIDVSHTFRRDILDLYNLMEKHK